MGANRLTGPGAGSEKYDLLTALAVAGLSGSPTHQATMLRLIALVTARYNWANDELSVGQREMAAMWSVDERTVKREIKRMTTAELLLQKRAGVRGRVAVYRLNVAQVYRLSEPVWRKVGPDFADRMDQRIPRPAVPAETVVRVDFQTRSQPKDVATGSWQRVLSRLEGESPTSVAAWFSKLLLVAQTDNRVTLQAPTKFIAQYVQTHLLPMLTAAARAELGAGVAIDLLSP
jgi:hypothetical protein